MRATCAACKGIDDANYIIMVDHTYPLYLCRSCLQDAPGWAGWPTWSDDMKAQRERLLAEENRKMRKIVEAHRDLAYLTDGW